ncbi:MAG: hypothetical protein ACYC41_05970 [Bacillota bacterium]
MDLFFKLVGAVGVLVVVAQWISSRRKLPLSVLVEHKRFGAFISADGDVEEIGGHEAVVLRGANEGVRPENIVRCGVLAKRKRVALDWAHSLPSLTVQPGQTFEVNLDPDEIRAKMETAGPKVKRFRFFAESAGGKVFKTKNTLDIGQIKPE